MEQVSTPAAPAGPAIILVHPQLAENIGMCARAMMNFGLTDMRLVAPRDGWPRKGAHAAASGAVAVLETARLFGTVEEAVGDLTHVFATTARGRDQVKPVVAADGAAVAVVRMTAEGARAGVLFGPERMGLSNDHVALADTILSFPVNPAFASVNLAQSVLLVGYEWFKHAAGGAPRAAAPPDAPPAPREHLFGFMETVERELDAAGFFYPPERRDVMVRNLRNIWHRSALSRQDVQTLRGMVQALVTGLKPGHHPTAPPVGGPIPQGAGSIPEGD